MKRLLLLLLTIGISSGVVFAHNGMQHVMGTIASISDRSITVRTTAGATQTVALSGDTKYSRGPTPVALKDLKVGDRIVVHATGKSDQLTAAEVQVGIMKGMHGDASGEQGTNNGKAPR